MRKKDQSTSTLGWCTDQQAAWHALELANSATALAEQMSQMAKATHYWISIDCPDAWAVFIRGAAATTPSIRRYQHQATTLYFPPSAAAYAQTVEGAVLCPKPPRTGLRVLVGHPRIPLDIYFS